MTWYVWARRVGSIGTGYAVGRFRGTPAQWQAGLDGFLKQLADAGLESVFPPLVMVPSTMATRDDLPEGSMRLFAAIGGSNGSL